MSARPKQARAPKRPAARGKQTLSARLLAALAKTPHAEVSPSAFSERDAVWVNGKELAHLHADGTEGVVVDLRLGRARCRDAAKDARFHHRSRASDWIEMRVTSSADIQEAVRLLAAPAAEHAPLGGKSPKPPPAGPDLLRRRRFH